MLKLWGLLKSDQKIIQNHVASSDADGLGAFRSCLDELCHTMDIQKPVILRKHENEFKNFGRTVFRPSDFIEPVEFSSFEVENITQKKEKNDRRPGR